MPLLTDIPAIPRPVPAGSTLWRYIDLPRYLAMLNSKALYLRRLSTFTDPFEGYYPKATEKAFLSGLAEVIELSSKEDAKLIASIRAIRESTYVSCWHESPHESDAMWRLYAQAGIAVRTSRERIARALGPDSASIMLAGIVYLDYEKDTIPPGNAYWHLSYKRIAFAHEREARLILTEPPDQEKSDGRLVAIDPSILIEEVVVSPLEKDWFASLVSDMTTFLGCNAPVRASRLMAAPEG